MSPLRFTSLIAILALVYLGLASRLVVLQVVRRDAYRGKAERRRRRLEFLAPHRGRISDRRGRTLAVDQPDYEVSLELTDFDPSLGLLFRLAGGLGFERQDVLARAAAARARARSGDRLALVTGPLSVRQIERFERFRSALRKRGKGLGFMVAWRELEGRGLPVTRYQGAGIAIPMALLRLRDQRIAVLADLLGQPRGSLTQAIDARVAEIAVLDNIYDRYEAWGRPLVLVRGLDFAAALALEERLFELPGVRTRKRFQRVYPYGALTGHVVGYTGAMGPEDIARLGRSGQIADLPRWYHRRIEKSVGRELPYPPERLLFGLGEGLPDRTRLFDAVRGRRGLEASLDDRLAGRPGIRVVERDSKGKELGLLGHVPERHGEDLRLSLDLDIQKAAAAVLDKQIERHGSPGCGGAAVMIDARSGAVLALVSAPRFDPATLGRDFEALQKDPRKPLFHRAGAAVPPGSTFKIITSLALFGSHPGALSIHRSFTCVGILHGKRCDATHGTVGLSTALEHSCNIFYWLAVHRGGYEPVARLARALGFGAPVGRGIPGEGGGMIPDEAAKVRRFELARAGYQRWKKTVAALEAKKAPANELDLARRKLIRAEDWARRCAGDQKFSQGNARNAVIGQGSLEATPLQVAVLAAFIGSEGRLVTPHLLADQGQPPRRLALDPAAVRVIKRGLRKVVLSGTASRASIGLRSLDVAGKTGTAERRRGEPKYAWFMGYYPSADPEVAFAVVIDRTMGHGGSVAGPVARALVEAYAAGEARR